MLLLANWLIGAHHIFPEAKVTFSNCFLRHTKSSEQRRTLDERGKCVCVPYKHHNSLCVFVRMDVCARGADKGLCFVAVYLCMGDFFGCFFCLSSRLVYLTH